MPVIEDALTNIVLKKPSFTALIVGDALVLQDLQKLNASTVAFENALVAIAPVSLVLHRAIIRELTMRDRLTL